LKNGEVVSHDEIAKALWGGKAEEKFSLWAITKLVQKIRAKLMSLGISSNLIYTVYGKGYGC
jgi:DNA-binding winged helix-turn-helix (wHTH) protein